jgi:hypothetical protein
MPRGGVQSRGGYNCDSLMALSFGTMLGPYEVQSPLGAGGMGEVYRARETRGLTARLRLKSCLRTFVPILT